MPVPAADLRVGHPFQLTLAHRRLKAREMVHASRVFDFHEVGGGRLAVGVDEVHPERTILRVTPNRPMTYEEIGQETEAILEDLGPRAYGEVPVLERLDWLAQHAGIDSAGRQGTRRVR